MKKKIKFIEKTIDGEVMKIQARTIALSGFKALDEEGTFEAYASVFGNVDSYGEIVDAGAFKEWLSEYFDGGKGRYPKCVWNHDWSEPIAQTLECREDERGLYVKGKFVMEVQRAKEIFALMKAGVITDFSFGFRVLEDSIDPATNLRHLTKIAIYEYSPVLVGANNQATLLGVKSSEQIRGEEVEEEVEVPVAPAAEAETPAEETPAAAEPATDPEPEAEAETPAAETPAETPAPETHAPAADPEKSIARKAAITDALEAARALTNALEALQKATEDEGPGRSSDTSPVEGRRGKEGEGETKVVLRGILRDARKADKIMESVIIRAKAIIR